MPPVPMSTPMVMKKGTAIREKDQTPFTICWGRVTRFCPMEIMHSTVEIPTAYAIGKRISTRSRKLPSRMIVDRVSASMPFSLLCCFFHNQGFHMPENLFQFKDDHAGAGHRYG